MSGMAYAFKIMNSLLLEATLKDSFSSFVEDAKIRLRLEDGSEKLFIVREVMPGRVKVVDRDTKILYTFTNDAIKNGEFTMHKYDRNKGNYEGEELKFGVKEFMVGKEGGEITFVDIIDPQLKQRMGEMNAELKKAKRGDMLYISSEEQRAKGDNLTNTLLLRVNDVEPEMLTTTLDNIESDQPTNSMDKLGKIFRNRNIYINIDDMVKIVDDDLVLNLNTADNLIPIRGLLAIETHGGDEFESEDEKEFAKQELINKIKNSSRSKDYLEAIDKTPNFWDTLMNASPKGVNQLGNLLNQAVTSSTYLTPGNYVKFKLGPETQSFIVNSDAKIVKDKIYNGIIEKNNIIKHGTRRRGHWEMKIVKEINPTTFKVKMRYCNKDLNCKPQGEGTIKLVRNG